MKVILKAFVIQAPYKLDKVGHSASYTTFYINKFLASITGIFKGILYFFYMISIIIRVSRF